MNILQILNKKLGIALVVVIVCLYDLTFVFCEGLEGSDKENPAWVEGLLYFCFFPVVLKLYIKPLLCCLIHVVKVYSPENVNLAPQLIFDENVYTPVCDEFSRLAQGTFERFCADENSKGGLRFLYYSDNAGNDILVMYNASTREVSFYFSDLFWRTVKAFKRLKGENFWVSLPIGEVYSKSPTIVNAVLETPVNSLRSLPDLVNIDVIQSACETRLKSMKPTLLYGFQNLSRETTPAQTLTKEVYAIIDRINEKGGFY